MRSAVLCAILCVFFTVLAMPTTAWADTKGEAKTTKARQSEADKAKKEANALMGQDRYADALALYQKAYELSSDPALLYNQARALEAMGEYPEAVDKLERFEKDAAPSLRAKVPALKELMADLRGRIATLVVTTNASGARLLVRGKDAGTITSELKLRTRGGPATVEVAAEGYITFKKDVELAAGSTVRVDAQLQLKKSDAVIFVRSKPQADISVDGKAIGRSPLEFRLPGGRHTLVADADGYESESVPMTLALGDRRELDVELRKSPKITSRWWFWTAIAAVAVTGVAIGTYALITTEQAPPEGTFPNGGVRPFQP